MTNSEQERERVKIILQELLPGMLERYIGRQVNPQPPVENTFGSVNRVHKQEGESGGTSPKPGGEYRPQAVDIIERVVRKEAP